MDLPSIYHKYSPRLDRAHFDPRPYSNINVFFYIYYAFHICSKQYNARANSRGGLPKGEGEGSRVLLKGHDDLLLLLYYSQA